MVTNIAANGRATPEYSPQLRDGDRWLAILDTGDRQGLWKYLAKVDSNYLIERSGHLEVLTGPEVDRLVFDNFVATTGQHVARNEVLPTP